MNTLEQKLPDIITRLKDNLVDYIDDYFKNEIKVIKVWENAEKMKANITDYYPPEITDKIISMYIDRSEDCECDNYSYVSLFIEVAMPFQERLEARKKLKETVYWKSFGFERPLVRFVAKAVCKKRNPPVLAY